VKIWGRGGFFAALDYFLFFDHNGHMITNLCDAKSRLSHLVQLAAQGEEIVITVHGKPMARLMPMTSPSEDCSTDKERWIEELTRAADKACPEPTRATGQDFWDQIRQDRI
jgi:prevent-host-death family protein